MQSAWQSMSQNLGWELGVCIFNTFVRSKVGASLEIEGVSLSIWRLGSDLSESCCCLHNIFFHIFHIHIFASFHIFTSFIPYFTLAILHSECLQA